MGSPFNINQLSGAFGVPEDRDNFSLPYSVTDLMLSCAAKGLRSSTKGSIASYSNFNDDIDTTYGRLRGYTRDWGAASSDVQLEVMRRTLNATRHYSIEDRAILLGTMYIESGFNPDAAAKSTSASGLFQFINKTGLAYGLTEQTRFDADANLSAGLKLYDENVKLLNRKYSNLTGTDRATRIYALHHDGPSLAYGGDEIAQEKLLPLLPKFEALVEAYDNSIDS